MAQRTPKQNNGIHLYCEQLAEALNEAGWTMKVFFEQVKKVDVDWDKESVKKVIWKEIQKAMLDKTSTRDLSKSEVSKVYEQVDKVISENTGVHVEFPSEQP